MSHCLGVMCIRCDVVLEPDRCPEGCRDGHGFGYQEPNEWAARTWPDHPCFTPAVVLCSTDSCACTCRAPADTPSGMHHDNCPTNPASRRKET